MGETGPLLEEVLALGGARGEVQTLGGGACARTCTVRLGDVAPPRKRALRMAVARWPGRARGRADVTAGAR